MHNRLINRVVLTSIISGLLVLSIVFKTNAETSPNWIDTDITFHKDFELAPGTPLPTSFNGNRDCKNHKFITRPAKIHPELSYQACGVETRFGIVDPNGKVELNNTGVTGSLINHPDFGTRPGLIPIPNSSTVINAQSAPNSVFLYFTKDTHLSLKSTVQSSGELTYSINKSFDARLRDKSNKLLQAHTDSLSFSNNGKWMVVDSPNLAMLRVNLETFEVLPFAPSFNSNIGIAPGLQTAISADGRYAVVASNAFSTFKIYDLDSCGAVPGSITDPVNCQFRDLLLITKQKIPNFLGLSMARFISDDSVSAYFSYQLTPGNSSTNRTAKYLMSTSTDISQRMDYLAVGDSYISGEGAYEYRNGTDIGTNKCHTSLRSYPYLLAQDLSLSDYSSIACSGALMGHITDTLIPTSKNTAPQAKGKTNESNDSEIYDNFLPGYRAQIKFVEFNRPRIVTISIGGNDIGFSNIVKKCLGPDTCYSTYEERLELVRLINRQSSDLKDTYSKIKNKTSHDSKIYAIGYPQIAKPGGNCALNVRLNSEELEFSRLIISYLNSVIKISANEAGVRYVDAEDALIGYRLCETESFGVAVNGLTAGDDIPDLLNGPLGRESYHPNAWGHTLLKNKILEKTNDLELVTPAPSPSPLPSENGLDVLNVPKSGSAVSKLFFDEDLSNDIIYREAPLSIAIEGLKYALKPLTSFQVWLNSEPVLLGSSSIDSAGNFNVQVSVPQNVTAGFHSLQVKGLNQAGETISIQKTVYVAAAQTDLDGDGQINSEDACVFIEPAGQDLDKDGIDDGCDGLIDIAPAVGILALSSNSTSPVLTVLTPPTSNSSRPRAAPIPVTGNTPPQQPQTEANSTASDVHIPNGSQEGVVLGSSISKDKPWKWNFTLGVAVILGLAGTVLWILRKKRVRG